MPASQAIAALARDHRSGSTPLALRACELLSNCGSPSGPNVKEFYRDFALAVAQTQPAMAAVWNVCDRWLRRVEDGANPFHCARRIARELSHAQRAAARHAAALLRDGQAVMTYSASSTIEAALLMAHRARRRFRFLCSEGRPMLEGRALAERLASRGIPVEFFTDAALLASLPDANLVLVGCDAISPHGFVNKVGTHALLRMARLARIPAYVVADTFKFLPAVAVNSFGIREEAVSEVWSQKRAIRTLRIRNFYFEKVPLEACSGLIMEKGLCFARSVPKFLRGMESDTVLGYAQRRSRRANRPRR